VQRCRPARLASVALLWVAVLCLPAGCAGELFAPPPEQPLFSSSAEDFPQPYRIGPLDVLSVRVWKQPDLTLEGVVVRSDGMISMPLLDDIAARGLTTLELKDRITSGLSAFVERPTVTVVVVQSNSQVIYLLGEVARKGALTLAPGMRVVDAISVAGGFTPFADSRRVKVIRNRVGSAPLELWFDYDAFLEGDSLDQNVLLQAGDKVVVPEASPFFQ